MKRVLVFVCLLVLAIAPVVNAELLIWNQVGSDCAQVTVYDKETSQSATSYSARGTQDDPQANSWFVINNTDYQADVRYSFVATCKDSAGDESGYSGEARYTFWVSGGGTKGPLPPQSFGLIDCQQHTDPGATYYQICVDAGEI